MHELSIALGIVEAAVEEAQQRNVQVSAVHLRLGALSGVVKDGLLFSYEVACQDTPLQGSRLLIEDVPQPCTIRNARRSGCSSRCSCSPARNAAHLQEKSSRGRNRKCSHWRRKNERTTADRSAPKCPEAE